MLHILNKVHRTLTLWLNLLSSTLTTKGAPKGVIGRCWRSQEQISLMVRYIWLTKSAFISSILAALLCFSSSLHKKRRINSFPSGTLGKIPNRKSVRRLLLFLHAEHRLTWNDIMRVTFSWSHTWFSRFSRSNLLECPLTTDIGPRGYPLVVLRAYLHYTLHIWEDLRANSLLKATQLTDHGLR